MVRRDAGLAMLTAAPDSPRPWARESRLAFLCPVPGYDRHFAICQDLGIEMITVVARRRRADMDAVEQLVAADPAIKGMWCVPNTATPRARCIGRHG